MKFVTIGLLTERFYPKMIVLFLQTIFSCILLLTNYVHGKERAALLVIDVQKCFIKGGNLAVSEGEDLVPIINDIRQSYSHKFDAIYFSLDSHPERHVSFATQHNGKLPFEVITLRYNNENELCGPTTLKNSENISRECNGDAKVIEQVLWPDHCILGTDEAELAPGLSFDSLRDKFIFKGSNFMIDSYSAFSDNGNLTQTDLHKRLQEGGINVLFLVGIATDYCVKFSALDAAYLGYKVYVIVDATRGVAESSYREALREMEYKNIQVIKSSQLQHIMEDFRQDEL